MASSSAVMKCTVCGEEGFTSRNKLFAHIRDCTLDRNPAKATLIEDEELFRQNPGTKYYLYATGGKVRGKTILNAERYDFQHNVWEPITNMNDHRSSHGCAAVGPYVYAVGGGGLDSNLTTMERYDPYRRRWDLVSSMPSERHALSMLSIGHLLFAIGGWAYGTISCPAIEIYNTLTDSWTRGQDILTPRRLMGCTSLHNCIYTFGGLITDGHPATHTEIYYVDEDRWVAGPPLPGIGGQCSAVTSQGYIYVAIHGDALYRFCPSNLTFTRLCPSLPRPRWFNFDMKVFNDRLYILGGNIEGVWSHELWRYDYITNTWTRCADMHQERRRCGSTVVTMEPSFGVEADGAEAKVDMQMDEVEETVGSTSEKRPHQAAVIWHGTVRQKKKQRVASNDV